MERENGRLKRGPNNMSKMMNIFFMNGVFCGHHYNLSNASKTNNKTIILIRKSKIFAVIISISRLILNNYIDRKLPDGIS